MTTTQKYEKVEFILHLIAESERESSSKESVNYICAMSKANMHTFNE